MAKKTIRRVKYPLEDNVKRVLFVRPGEGGGSAPLPFEIPYATRAETDAGVLLDKALNPDVGAYAYDRLRHVGRHEAGKGTRTVSLSITGGVCTVDDYRSNVFRLLVTEPFELVMINPLPGQVVKLRFKQDETGGHGATWPANFRWIYGSTPSLSTAPGAVDCVYAAWDESDLVWECAFQPDYTGSGTGWGTSGGSGGSGATIGGSWSFSSDTAAADPGNKRFSFNNSTLTSVTEIYFNDTTNENFDAGTLLSFLEAGFRIYVQQGNDATRAALFEVSGAPTDNTGWWTVPVTVVASGLLPTNTANCAVVFQLSASGGGGGGGGAAADITYSNYLSGLTATDVQDALDELQALIEAVEISIPDGDAMGADPVNKLVLYDDCFAVGHYGITGNSATVTGEAGAPGVLNLITGTSSAGATNAKYGVDNVPTLTSNSSIVVGGGEIIFEARVKVSAISDGTQTYISRIGLADEFDGAPGNGIYFGTTSAAGVWQYSCRDGATSLVDDSGGLTPGNNTWRHIKFVINAAGTSVEFFVDGVSKQTITTNIPTAALAVGANIVKSAGTTSRTLSIDWWKLTYTPTTPRGV